MKRLLAGLLAVILLLALAVPVYATDLPSSISIMSAKVVRNTIEDGDISIVFHYKISYTDDDYPDDPAANTIMFRLYSTDGATLLASSTPYVYFRNGYGQGVSSMYFDKDAVEDLDIEWEDPYKINIAGSPAYFDPLPDPYYFTLTTSDYSSTEEQADNQAILKSYIVSVCTVMELAYPTYILHGSTDVGIVLTAIGEAYFRGAIPGIASMAPDLFFIQSYTPKEMPVTYDTSQAEVYKERLEGSDVMEGFDAIGTATGISGGTVAAFAVFIACIALIIFLAAKGWGVEPGIIGAGIIMTLGALLLGDAVMVLRMFMGFIGGLMIMYILFLRKA